MITFVPSKSAGNAYCINWNSQKSQVLNGVKSLLMEDLEALTDVTFACGGDYVHAHKVILSLCSSFFKDLFMKNNASKMNTIIILGNVRAVDLRYLLQFIYQGKVDIPSENIKSFLEAGKILGIEGLTGYLLDPDIVFGVKKNLREPPDETNVNCHRRTRSQTVKSLSPNYSVTTPPVDNESTLGSPKKRRLSEPCGIPEPSESSTEKELDIFSESINIGDGDESGEVEDPLDVSHETIEEDDGIEIEMDSGVKTEPIRVYSGCSEAPPSEILPDDTLEDPDESSLDSCPVIVSLTGSVTPSSSTSLQFPIEPKSRRKPHLKGKRMRVKPAVHNFYARLSVRSEERNRPRWKCLICGANIKECDNRTRNLISHLNNRHPEAYEEVRLSIDRYKQGLGPRH